MQSITQLPGNIVKEPEVGLPDGSKAFQLTVININVGNSKFR
jgi:hypothetical protein